VGATNVNVPLVQSGRWQGRRADYEYIRVVVCSAEAVAHTFHRIVTRAATFGRVIDVVPFAGSENLSVVVASRRSKISRTCLPNVMPGARRSQARASRRPKRRGLAGTVAQTVPEAHFGAIPVSSAEITFQTNPRRCICSIPQ
jgi:hypothetical protein